MSLTGVLGSPSSQLGNIELGAQGVPPTPLPVSVWHVFTGIPGAIYSQPSFLVPGLGLPVPVFDCWASNAEQAMRACAIDRRKKIAQMLPFLQFTTLPDQTQEVIYESQWDHPWAMPLLSLRPAIAPPTQFQLDADLFPPDATDNGADIPCWNVQMGQQPPPLPRVERWRSEAYQIDMDQLFQNPFLAFAETMGDELPPAWYGRRKAARVSATDLGGITLDVSQRIETLHPEDFSAFTNPVWSKTPPPPWMALEWYVGDPSGFGQSKIAILNKPMLTAGFFRGTL
jgi:hypothetical protein